MENSNLSCVISLRSSFRKEHLSSGNWSPFVSGESSVFALFWLDHLSYAIWYFVWGNFLLPKTLQTHFQNDKYVLVKILKWLINFGEFHREKGNFLSFSLGNFSKWVSKRVRDWFCFAPEPESIKTKIDIERDVFKVNRENNVLERFLETNVKKVT